MLDNPTHRGVALAAHMSEDQSQHQAACDASKQTGRLAVAVPPSLGDDALDATAPRAVTKAARGGGLPRLFLIEDEYIQTMLRAELAWVRSLIGDLRSRKITWSAEWLRKVAAAFDAHGCP